MAKKFNLKVTPDLLINKSNEIQSEVNKIRKSYEGIRSILKASKGYWVGVASEKHQKAFKKLDSEMELTINRLGEHPTDLLKMANLYNETENKVTSFANSIQSDVIV